MSEMGTALFILALPFLFGMALGIEIVRRRPPSVYERFGKMVADRISSVSQNRVWVGKGCIISNTMELEYDGQRLEIVVRNVDEPAS